MGIVLWLICGAIVGWIASLLVGTNSRQGWVMNIGLGILGAVLGGLTVGMIEDGEFHMGWDIRSLIIAVLGAMVVSWGFAYFTRERR
jgi:uncharacterized membrane protein YeaQ/YmgE (transglycosylase-associated protein family)